MKWYEAVESTQPHVVQITTPSGSGTGFLLWRAIKSNFCSIATAAHVVHHAHYWEQPIRIRVASTGETVLLRAEKRAMQINEERDTAAILFDASKLTLPSTPLELMDKDHYLKVGASIGWLGFPAIPGADLCFFTGGISAWVDEHEAYFVDGVTINGVSGGPAFEAVGSSPTIIGFVSAYMPNRATGETLPRLGIVREVIQLHKYVQQFQSVEEAQAEEDTKTAPPQSPVSPNNLVLLEP